MDLQSAFYIAGIIGVVVFIIWNVAFFIVLRRILELIKSLDRSAQKVGYLINEVDAAKESMKLKFANLFLGIFGKGGERNG